MPQKSGSTHTSKRCALHKDFLSLGSYIVSFDLERHYQGLRYHWVICNKRKQEELDLWGHATTLLLAEEAARSVMEKLR